MEQGNEGDEIILLAFRQIEWYIAVWICGVSLMDDFVVRSTRIFEQLVSSVQKQSLKLWPGRCGS